MIIATLKRVLLDSSAIFWELCKILIPILFLLKLLEPLGLIELIASVLEPTMTLVGLPGYTAIVWASALFGNLYTGLIVLVTLWDQQPLTVAQVSTLCLMMLIAHGILVEVIIAHKSGANALFSCIWRMVNAYIMGWISYIILQTFSLFTEPATLYLEPTSLEDSWQQWVIEQILLLIQVYCIIVALNVMMQTIKAIGIETYLHRVLSPLLKLFHLSDKTANITLIGLILGISYGAAFLIDDVKKSRVSRKEGCVVLSILNLNHALIEDTLLMLLVGSTLWIVLLIRLILGLLFAFLFCQTLKCFPIIERWVVS